MINKEGCANQTYFVKLSDETTGEIVKTAKSDLFLELLVLMSTSLVYLRTISGNNAFTVYFPVSKNQQTTPLFYRVHIEYDKTITYKDFLLNVRQQVMEEIEKYDIIPLNDDAIYDDLDNISMKFIISLESLHGKHLVNDINLLPLDSVSWNTTESGFIGTFRFMRSTEEDLKVDTGTQIKEIFRQVMCNKQVSLDTFEAVLEQNIQKAAAILQGECATQRGTVIDRLREVCVKYADKTALIINHRKYSYASLWRRIMAISANIQKVCYSSVVAIYADYSFDMIAAVFAVLHSGNAYLPIESGMSDARIESAMKLTECKLCLGNYDSKSMIRPSDLSIMCYEDIGEVIQDIPTVNIKDFSIAYVIFTSGTTGEPKAIPIQHQSLNNFVSYKIDTYQFGPGRVCLQTLSFLFDAFGANLYPPILSGGTMVMINNALRENYRNVCEVIKQYQVTDMNIVPSYYAQLMECVAQEEFCSIQYIVLGGEIIKKDVVAKSKTINTNLCLVNEYGPSENTITTTYHIDIQEENQNLIGKPIQNVQLCVVNAQNEPLALGTRGELCVSGMGLTLGYLDGKNDSFFTANGKIFYRTGDMVKTDISGNIYFLGRIDSQISLNGYRIDPEEIEGAIITSGLANDSVVAVSDDKFGNTYLCAYLVRGQKSRCTVSEIQEQLAKKIPHYMIPHKFIDIGAIPLTKNGKKDRKAVKNEINQTLLTGEYYAPNTKTEKIIADIWKDILHMEQVSIKDSFFEIGGNSLLVMQVHSALADRFEQNISIPDLFTYHTIQSLGAFLERSDREKIISTVNFKAVGLKLSCFCDECTDRGTSISGEIRKKEIPFLYHTDEIVDGMIQRFSETLLQNCTDRELTVFTKKKQAENYCMYKYSVYSGQCGGELQNSAIIISDLQHFATYTINEETGCLIFFQRMEESEPCPQNNLTYMLRLSVIETPEAYHLLLENDCETLLPDILEDIFLHITDIASEPVSVLQD